MPPSKVIVIVCVFVLRYAEATLPKTVTELKTEILDQILPKNGNEILVGPGNSTNGATTVEVFMHILSIETNEEKMEFTVGLLLRETWKDYRLKYDSKDQFKNIVINDPDAIWTPDLVFANIREGHGYDITHPNVFIRIYPDGSVLYNRKLSVTASCPMNLKDFPFDRQECQLKIASFGSTLDDVIFLWRDYGPITIQQQMQILLFDLEKVSTSAVQKSLNVGIEFRYLVAHFYLSRTFSYYLYHVYIPSITFVLLSWFPFWMNKKLLIGRLMISLGALLTYSLVIYDFNRHQAKVSYKTRLLCFIGTCLSFLFISLIESLLTQMLTEKEGRPEIKDCVLHKEGDEKIERIKCWIAKVSCKTNYVDLLARTVIPLTFTVFCIIYFATVKRDDLVTVGDN